MGTPADNIKELELPSGLEFVGDEWFANSGIEKVIISATVKELRTEVFKDC